MDKVKFFVLWFILLLLAKLSCAKLFLVNGITNISYNTHLNKNKEMELGNVVFHFSKKPIVKLVSKKINDGERCEEVFIFPGASVNASKIFGVNNKKFDLYKLKIEKIVKPTKGIKFSLIYDHKKLFIDCKINSRGITFSFYNKKLVDKILTFDDSVLRIT